MNYQTLTPWIFFALVLMVFLMAVHPSSFVIWLGFIGLPVLVLFQVFIVLKGKDESTNSFGDKWYDR
jgi:hypothetical protein